MPISKKQQMILAFSYTKHYQALICDGAVRTGKTSLMTVAFVDWSMREFNNVNFAICGKTVGSAIKNIIVPFMALSYARKRYRITFTRSDNKMIVQRGNTSNVFYVYGGKDESSYMLIQGITLGGVLFDEVALMARSFVEQALARCLSYKNRRYWFNCNPDSPNHWFYKEWIQQLKKHKALHLHFLMTDNPILDEETLREAESTWSGVFYDRYVLGKWVKAEGLIYPMFNSAIHVIHESKMPHNQPQKAKPYDKYYISSDYGTLNPCAFLLWGLRGGVWYAIDEYYYSGRKNTPRTDEEHYRALEALAGKLEIAGVIIDPSAASFITLIQRKRRFKVISADNAVLDGIRDCATALQRGALRFSSRCVKTIEEFGLYTWDEKKEEDAPVKENDHAMDAMRYFVRTLHVVPKAIKTTKHE